MSQIIVVGGGASGLTAAIFAARKKHKVIILEQKDKVGKKILATGNGKCNYTNRYQGIECYRGSDNTFALKVLEKFGVKETLEFFEDLGIHPKEKNGYIYPNSEQASSVVEVLKMELKTLQVPVYCGVRVEKILYQDNKYVVFTNTEKFQGDKIILAAGGCASPNLGSDGSGFKLAKELGHRIINPLPALVQLKSKEKYLKTIAGVRAEALVSLFLSDEFCAKEKGEVLFTDYGVSGIPILQLSRYGAKALEEKKKVFLSIDFFPDVNLYDLSRMLSERVARSYYKTIEEMFIGFINNKLAYICLKELGVDPTLLCSKLNKNKILVIARQLKEWKIPISETNSFEQAQVTAGGVDTKEINPDTLESKKRRGLYFTGEIIDVDGTCGGYNLQWAWSCAAVAGKSI